MVNTRRYRKKSSTHKQRQNKRKSRKHASKHKRRRSTVSKKSMRRKGVRKHNRRSHKRRMRGGSSSCLTTSPVPYKVGTGIPAGKGSLPIQGRNYYKLSPDIHAPNGEIMNTSLHTSVPKTFLSNQAGGSGLTKLMPQDLLDLGRSIIGGAETLYDNWQGQEPPVSSNVMVQPINNTKNPMPTTIDMNKLEMRADHRAASA